MDIKELVSKIEESSEFKEFIASDKDSYLANIFQIIEQGQSIWQVGYFNSQKDKMTLFVFLDSILKVVPNQDVFKKPGSTVEKLDLSVVSVSLDEASSKVDKIIDEKYSAMKPIKRIVILQNQSGKTIWNFTFMAQSMPINIRLDATNLELISDKKIDLIDKNESFK